MLYSHTGKSTSSQRRVFKLKQHLVQSKARNFRSAGQPDFLLVDGLAKLAPGLKTARQTGPGKQQLPLSRFVPRAHYQPPHLDNPRASTGCLTTAFVLKQLRRWTLVCRSEQKYPAAFSGADNLSIPASKERLNLLDHSVEKQFTPSLKTHALLFSRFFANV